MHLKSLELTGFKSFAEAKIQFPQGITSVVGPNGTGKSNVVDAILWVLGEQSAKTLRSERMEDVIFNGTEMRKPLGLAEVSLVMSGIQEERLKGVPGLSSDLSEYDEVMVTRRLYRNGDSEYLINKIPCRLKDIRSLFLDTRAGTKGHTIIEQGRIEQILNATPQDRRELIEETAGIVRYKKQKAEALRKLDSTQQNLLRVRDIITEVRRQLNSLERQARQARSYQKLQDEAKTLEILLLTQECRALLSDRTAVEAQLGELQEEDAGQLARQATLETELEAAKLRLLGIGDSVARIREDLGRVEQQQAQALTASEVEKGRLALYEQQRAGAQEELSRIESNRAQVAAAIEALRDQLLADETVVRQRLEESAALEDTARALAARRVADAENEHHARQGLIGLTVQLTRAENAVTSLEAQDEQALRRVERLNKELEDLESQHREMLERFEQTATGRTDGEETVQTLRRQVDEARHETRRLDEEVRGLEQTIRRYEDEAAAVESRLRALQGVLREEMGYGREGEEEATSIRSACAGVKESVAEWLRVPPGLERAVEAVLGERLRAWLISEPGDARRAVEFLNHQGLGRGTFVPAEPRYAKRAESEREPEWWPSLKGQAGVVGRAVDLLRVETESQDIVWCLFDGVVIVNSLDVAIEHWKRGLWTAPNGPTLVTIDGEIVDAAGVITGGTAGSSGGLLLRRREVQRLGEAKADIARALQEHRQHMTEQLSQAQAGRDTVQRLEESIRQGEMRLLGLMKDESSLRRTIDDLSQRLETVRDEQRIQDEERSRYRGEIEAFREQSARLKEEQQGRESTLAGLQQRLRACDEESHAVQQRLTDSRTALAGAKAKFEHAQADLSRLQGEQEQEEARITALDDQLSGLAESMDHSRIEQERNEARFRELDRQAAAIRQDLHVTQQRYEEDLQSSQRFDEELAAVRRALADNRERRTAVQVRRAEINAQLAVRQDTLSGTYQLSVEAALAQPPESAAPAVDEPSIREQLQKLRDRLARMGPINLAAIDEHRELEERHRFLTTQEEDLSKSVTSLKEIIARINRTTKDMFVETFRELQEKFSEVFARFFPGGRAELVLTEPEPDPEGAPTSEEPGVDIAAQPPGKRLKSITMLSGGEKTLTAMALIFASFLIRPTPFCILDEIDAPLDEENIGRFAAVLRELSQNAQFIVITHNKRTMSIADSLFGVTMEEPGVSKLVSVRLADLQPA